jgi:hypothetical protein
MREYEDNTNFDLGTMQTLSQSPIVSLRSYEFDEPYRGCGAVIYVCNY